MQAFRDHDPFSLATRDDTKISVVE
jgi:hypothetical protein